MQTEIDNKVRSKDAYDKAVQKGSRYVMDNEFRLKFLRANYFDVRKAAMNFVKYLDFLDKYYGEEALMRPLYFSDLGTGELELLRAGHMNLFSQRDRSGRRILNVCGSYRKEYTVFSQVSCSTWKMLTKPVDRSCPSELYGPFCLSDQTGPLCLRLGIG